MLAGRARARFVPRNVVPIFNSKLYDWYRTGMAVNHHAHEQEHPLTPLIYQSFATLTDGATGTIIRQVDSGEFIKGSVKIQGAPTGDMTITLYINGIAAMDTVIASGTTFTDFQLPTIVHYSTSDELSFSASGTAGAVGPYVFQSHINRLG